MASNDTLTRISPYAERLLDDYVYDQLADAGDRLHAAYSRVSGRSAKDSLEDRRLRRHVAGAGSALRNVAMAASGRKPKPKPRVPRGALAAVAAAGGIAVVVSRIRGRRERARFDPAKDEAASAQTVAPVSSIAV